MRIDCFDSIYAGESVTTPAAADTEPAQRVELTTTSRAVKVKRVE